MKSHRISFLVILAILFLANTGEAQKVDDVPSNISSSEFGMLNYNKEDSEAARKLSILFSKSNTSIARGNLDCGGFVTATWDDDNVYFLDNMMNVVSQFPAGSSDPNGITTDGTLIYTGHFTTQEVIAYDMNGVEQFRWSGNLGGLQGMVYINGELAIYRSSLIQFFDAVTGAFIREIADGSNVNIEGLTYDGTNIWTLKNDSLNAINPTDGTIVSTIPNAASSCSFQGTGIAVINESQLILSCTTGAWFIVSSLDGSIISSGNNGLDMYGLSGGCPINFESQAVPTLSEWGLIVLILLMLIIAVAFMRNRNKTSSLTNLPA